MNRKPPNAGKGRPKGIKNKATVERELIVQRAKEQTAEHSITFDPHKFMEIIAQNELACGKCRGKLRTKYMRPKEQWHNCQCFVETGTPNPECPECGGEGVAKIGTRICESCYGDGWEHCDPRLRGDMAKELAQYKAPKLKAIEVSGNLSVNVVDRLHAGRQRVLEDANRDKS